jgi:hypothetical protein
MKKVSFFKKISLYNFWRKSLSTRKSELLDNFNARVDSSYRIYTVINIPSALIEEPYNLRKSDIDLLAQTYIKEYSSKLSQYLNTLNLMELYDYYEVTKVDKYSYLIVFGFSLFKSHIFLRNLLLTGIGISTILIILFLIFIF